MMNHSKTELNKRLLWLKSSRTKIASLVGFALASCLALSSCEQQPNVIDEANARSLAETKKAAVIWPKLKSQVAKDPAIEKRIDSILSKMTLEQKIAQMIQPEIKDFTVEDMRRYGFGSYLNGGGSFPNGNKHATPQEWIDYAEAMYQASIDDSLDGSKIPTMWGTDAVHGHNNVIGATLFPHNIGLGAANNPELIEKIAEATAKEVVATGIEWIFAPTVAVVRDDRWGRTYEGYSEDPRIVREYSEAIVKGLQGAASEDFLSQQRVIATVKHFVGDGGTEGGDDQGNNIASEKELFEIHAQGYVSGLAAGAQTVMASFNSWHGKKNHGNHYLLTRVLKQRMGFDGFVVGDWNGHGQVKGCSNENCPQAINAGLDVFMVPTSAWKPLLENTIKQVQNGEISMQRVDDAVSRVLRVKLRAGLFDRPSPANRQLSGKVELIGAESHRAIARQAVRESLVLIKNKRNILPLSQHQNILITGDAADNIGKQSGGWSITWQGTGNENSDFPGGTSVLKGIKQKLSNSDGSIEFSIDGSYQQKPDVAIVVYGEEPYAEGNGDLDNLEYQRNAKRDLKLIRSLKSQGIPVVSVFISGRPMWVNPELNASDAFVAAWLPGTESAGIADVLFRDLSGKIDHDFVGKLSYSWPATPTQTTVNLNDQEYAPLFPYGYGLTYNDTDNLKDDLETEFSSTSQQLTTISLLKSPWRPAFSMEPGVKLIMSSSAENELINYRTSDKLVQEDARTVIFKGNALAGIEFNDNFPFDLRGYYEQNAALSFEMKLEKKLNQALIISMRCETDCDSKVDIRNLVNESTLGEWQRYSIDLECFAKLGATMDKIVAPFVIRTAEATKLSLANVNIEPNSADKASINCH